MGGVKMVKINQEIVAQSGWNEKSIPSMQVAIFVMCGGGLTGLSAAERPADFYIDGRIGKLPYSKREILQAVRTLITIATALGMNPRRLPTMPQFHNMGIF
jgi:hypothetical protein